MQHRRVHAAAKHEQHDEARAVDERHVWPEIERRAQPSAGDEVVRGGDAAGKREHVAEQRACRVRAARRASISGSATTHAPTIAMRDSDPLPRVGGSRSQTAESSATIAGCMLTSTTDAATVVMRTDAFHAQKWSASMTPAPTAISSAASIEALPLAPAAGGQRARPR